MQMQNQILSNANGGILCFPFFCFPFPILSFPVSFFLSFLLSFIHSLLFTTLLLDHSFVGSSIHPSLDLMYKQSPNPIVIFYRIASHRIASLCILAFPLKIAIANADADATLRASHQDPTPPVLIDFRPIAGIIKQKYPYFNSHLNSKSYSCKQVPNAKS
ncbi:hypothetical protein EYC80_009040 [Monilinia laxa]|uniref:Uncharacterized protein n=1 Tax=Monilinia laxa TaxID=61186 RepID=A0A5N6K278_MONLA|nr:hypothetical protein EYC80_009040 [Monilinia laxa]